MISDEIFIGELAASLKFAGMSKKDIKNQIDSALLIPVDMRDDYLEAQRKYAMRAQKIKALKKAVPTETSEQIAFVAWFKSNFPDVVIMMIRNDGYRTAREKPEQILMGLHAGAADLYVPAWHLWIEMKRIKGSHTSDKQLIFRDYVMSIGDSHIIGIGCEHAKAQVLANLDFLLNKKNK